MLAQLFGNRLRFIDFGDTRHLVSLQSLVLSHNQIAVLSPAVAHSLRRLRVLDVCFNALQWLPSELELLSVDCVLGIDNNPGTLTRARGRDDASVNDRARLTELMWMACLPVSAMRQRIATVCIAMQALELPALLSLLIVDALLPNDARMAAKWDIVVKVKHWHERFR